MYEEDVSRGGRRDVDSQRLSDQARFIRRCRLLSELEIEGIKRKVTETPNGEAQGQNTEKEPVGSEIIKLGQHRAMKDKFDEKEEIGKQSEEQNII